MRLQFFLFVHSLFWTSCSCEWRGDSWHKMTLVSQKEILKYHWTNASKTHGSGTVFSEVKRKFTESKVRAFRNQTNLDLFCFWCPRDIRARQNYFFSLHWKRQLGKCKVVQTGRKIALVYHGSDWNVSVQRQSRMNFLFLLQRTKFIYKWQDLTIHSWFACLYICLVTAMWWFELKISSMAEAEKSDRSKEEHNLIVSGTRFLPHCGSGLTRPLLTSAPPVAEVWLPHPPLKVWPHQTRWRLVRGTAFHVSFGISQNGAAPQCGNAQHIWCGHNNRIYQVQFNRSTALRTRTRSVAGPLPPPPPNGCYPSDFLPLNVDPPPSDKLHPHPVVDGVATAAAKYLGLF